MDISIVLATYNGKAYIRQQVLSIAKYLKNEDELIISDDGSNDGTVSIIKNLLGERKNVRYLHAPGQGVVRNFEFALGFANKDIIMFSDQDDIWLPEKLPKIRQIFERNRDIEVVMHDMYLSSNEEIEKDCYDKTSFATRERHHGVFYNLVFNGYYGCCMCFSKKFKSVIIPFSKYTNMYDEWIGLIAEYRKKVMFIPEPLIIHRVHDGNMGKKLSLSKKFSSRFILLISFIDFLINDLKSVVYRFFRVHMMAFKYKRGG